MKYTYINENMKTELGEMLVGDRRETITAAMRECANAGYRKGIICCAVVGIVGLIVGANAKQMRGDFVDRHIQRTVDKIAQNVCAGK